MKKRITLFRAQIESLRERARRGRCESRPRGSQQDAEQSDRLETSKGVNVRRETHRTATGTVALPMIWALALLLIAACPLATFGQSDIEKDPAYLPIDKVLDFKANPPQVNVNLPHFLLKDALSGLISSNASNNQMTELVDMLKDVKLIRVVVFEGNQSNKSQVEKAMKELRADVDSKWTSIVRVQDGKDNVGVYIIGDASGENVGGVAVLVHDGDEGDTVIVNVVGKVSIGRLIKLATQTKKLPPNILQMLSGMNGAGGGQTIHGSNTGGSGAQTIHGKDKDKDKENVESDAPKTNAPTATEEAPSKDK